MKKTLKVIGIVVIVVLIFAYIVGKRVSPLGSIAIGEAFNATTTTSVDAGVKSQVLSTTNRSSCMVGSVIVASTTTSTIGNFIIKDATSTTDVASTTFASFDAGVAAGTYTFDSACKRGIILEVPSSFDGAYTITWK